VVVWRLWRTANGAAAVNSTDTSRSAARCRFRRLWWLQRRRAAGERDVRLVLCVVQPFDEANRKRNRGQRAAAPRLAPDSLGTHGSVELQVDELIQGDPLAGRFYCEVPV